VNVLNKQFGIANKRLLSTSGVGHGSNKPSPYKISFWQNVTKVLELVCLNKRPKLRKKFMRFGMQILKRSVLWRLLKMRSKVKINSDQIPAEVTEAKVKYYRSRSMNTFILCGVRKKSDYWKEPTIYMKGDKNDFSNYQGISLL
jgi:hypothetical protein